MLFLQWPQSLFYRIDLHGCSNIDGTALFEVCRKCIQQFINGNTGKLLEKKNNVHELIDLNDMLKALFYKPSLDWSNLSREVCTCFSWNIVYYSIRDSHHWEVLWLTLFFYVFQLSQNCQNLQNLDLSYCNGLRKHPHHEYFWTLPMSLTSLSLCGVLLDEETLLVESIQRLKCLRHIRLSGVTALNDKTLEQVRRTAFNFTSCFFFYIHPTKKVLGCIGIIVSLSS